LRRRGHGLRYGRQKQSISNIPVLLAEVLNIFLIMLPTWTGSAGEKKLIKTIQRHFSLSKIISLRKKCQKDIIDQIPSFLVKMDLVTVIPVLLNKIS
jgi:hypothetical protein